jgi:copper chaperone CopZ
MTRALVVFLAAGALALVPAAARGAAASSSASEFPAGRYGVSVGGMLCAVDVRAIAAEWTKLPAVEKVSVDFETGRAEFTVRLGATLKLSALRRALRRAERVADLGAHYELGDAAYLP